MEPNVNLRETSIALVAISRPQTAIANRCLKHSWLYLHSLDSAAPVERLVAVDGRTPDEVYVDVAANLALNSQNAVAWRGKCGWAVIGRRRRRASRETSHPTRYHAKRRESRRMRLRRLLLGSPDLQQGVAVTTARETLPAG